MDDSRGSQQQWERVAPLIIGRPDQKGSPWRDLPEVFGAWNSLFRRFSR